LEDLQNLFAKARKLDPSGDYRLVPDDDFSNLGNGPFDLILLAFTFDNIPGWDLKVRLFRDLGSLLTSPGKIVSIVSAPEIYTHEWASFSTKDYPGNREAKTGDLVRIITTDFADRRPAEDILWRDEDYIGSLPAAGLGVIAKLKPLATGDEPYSCIK
jgi:hypothetical protein